MLPSLTNSEPAPSVESNVASGMGKKKKSFPASIPQLEMVEGRYVISEKTWKELNRQLQMSEPDMAPKPPAHPPTQRVVRRANDMRGIQLLFDATAHRHKVNPPRTALQEASEWRGMIHLFTSSRRCCKHLLLSLPMQTGDWNIRQQERRAQETEEMKTRREKQMILLEDQRPKKSSHQQVIDEWNHRQVEEKLAEVRDSYVISDLDKKIKKQEMLEERKAKLAEEVESARVSDYRKRAAERRANLIRKQQEIRNREKEVETAFSTTAKLRQEWVDEKETLGLKGHISVDLSLLDPRTGTVIRAH